MKSAYPDVPVEVLDFRYKNKLFLTRTMKAVRGRRGEDANYIVAKEYCASVQIRKYGAIKPVWFPIKVPKCFLTDLSSAPSWARWYVGRVGPHLEASVVHDWLFVAWQCKDRKPDEDMRQFADDVFLEAMRVARVSRLKRFVIYKASRWKGADLFYDKDCPVLAPCSKKCEVVCEGNDC